MHPRRPGPRFVAAAAASAAFLPLHLTALAAESDALALDPVVVTGSRVEHASFDLPASIDVIGADRITEGRPRVNASEALGGVAGLVVQNRQNYAQDLQISSRGFGARSAFGVRGVRLLMDGIPATTPDGQGQAATFNLDRAARIEVLRGPVSVLYGNHAGGVVQLFTQPGEEPASVEASGFAGSYGTWKMDLAAQGRAGGTGYVLDLSRFATEGYRLHSAATRDQSFARLDLAPDAQSRLSLIANGLWQHDTEDPLGLTWTSFQRDPRTAEAAALAFNTRKSIDHLQAGANYERRFAAGRLQATAYAGQRSVTQFQSIPAFVQANPRHSGGVVDFDRDFAGLDLRWIATHALGGGTLTGTLGLDLERSQDERRGYENFIGTRLGVQGRLRRDETDRVESVDPYAQAEWQGGSWVLTAGLRASRVRFEVDDRYLSNGDDSGSVTYRRTTPVVAALYKLTPALNVYASLARGFETPTLNELSYSAAGGGFNFALAPARSTHAEVGGKLKLGTNTRIDLALFQVKTENELVVDSSLGGRTSYRNAARTRRTGLELTARTRWRGGFSGEMALTRLIAVYDEAFASGGSTVPSGRRLPGVPPASFAGQLAWTHASGVTAAAEVFAQGAVEVDDRGIARPAPGYALLHLRLGAEQRAGGWRFKEFLRLENVFDRNVIGSVIVNDGNGRYYEPAPGRNWTLGLTAQRSF